jgi:3-hydroxyacyl-[acyl-carrier-protein] dehydratase
MRVRAERSEESLSLLSKNDEVLQLRFRMTAFMSELGEIKILSVKEGEGIKAAGILPEKAEFFQDHFPGFPILPGVLMLEILKRTADRYLNRSEAVKKFAIQRVTRVRFSAYLKPGDAWESELQLASSHGNQSEWNGKLLFQGRLAASARLFLESIE